MAAAVLSNRKQKLEAIDLIVTSSGTGPWHIGEGAHPTSQLVWEKAGYSHQHTASQFRANDFFTHDYILVMDSSNRANVLDLATSEQDRAKVFYLRSFDPQLQAIDPESADFVSLEVPDPYNQSEAAYHSVLEMIERSVGGFLELLRASHVASAAE